MEKEDDCYWIEKTGFYPFIYNWKKFGSLIKHFIEKGNIEIIRKLTEVFLEHGESQYKEVKEERRKFLSFVFREDFKTKAAKEMTVLFRQTWEKEKKFNKEIEREIKEKKEQEEESISPKEVKPKTKKEKHLQKSMASTLSPMAYNFLKLKTTKRGGRTKFLQEIVTKEGDEERSITFEVGSLSDKAEMTIDFLFDKFAKKDNAALLKAKETDIITAEKFAEIIQEFENHPYGAVIKFNSTEVRKTLEIRITDKELRKAIDELSMTKIELKGVKIWIETDKGEKGKYFKEITFTDKIVGGIIIEKTGRIEPRTKAAQHKFVLTFSKGWDLIFRNNIFNKRYACFGKDFYKLTKNTRALGRYLSCFKSTILTIEHISEIIGYKETINIRKRKVDIEKKLNELKKLGIIKKWRRVKKDGKEQIGKKSAWNITRA